MVRLKASHFALPFMVLLWSLVAFFGEYFCYVLARNRFVHLVPFSASSKFFRVLIVADPQIIGFNDAIFPVNRLNMIDSDRFMRSSFHAAFNHDNPDMVIFLGDIFDEGRNAIDPQYKQYIERFRSIFVVGPNIIKIHVCGDNDVGGGDSIDLYSDEHSLKFDNFTNDLGQFSHLSFEFIDFFKVNLLGRRVDMLNNRSVQKPRQANPVIVAAISHLPVLDSPTSFVPYVLKLIKPHLILSAHTHQGALTVFDFISNSHQFNFIHADTHPIKLRLMRNKIVEIMTPTCNYRMGSHETGYGSLLLASLIFWIINKTCIFNLQKYFPFGIIVLVTNAYHDTRRGKRLYCLYLTLGADEQPTSAHLAFLINLLTNCVYFQLWKGYDIFWIWVILLSTACVPSLRFDNDILNFVKLFTGKCCQNLRFKDILKIQVDEEKRASDRTRKIASALNFAIALLRLRISAAILYGNFRLKTRNYRLSAYSVLTFLQWDPFRILLWLDVSLFWFTLCLAWFRQFCLCCRLGCCRFYFLCVAVLVVGALIMEWPMYYLFRHMDDTWCRLDWAQFYNATFRRQ